MTFLLANNCNALRHTLTCKSYSNRGLGPYYVEFLARIFDHIYLVSPGQHGQPHLDPDHPFPPPPQFNSEGVTFVRKQNLKTL